MPPPAEASPGFTPRERELLLQSVREANRSQAAMAGRIADEIRQIYRNLDLRPQIIPVPMPPIVAAPMPQAMMPQAPLQPAWQGVPPGLETAGIPRFARDEELPEEQQGGEAGWAQGFAGLEPLPEEAAETPAEGTPEGAGKTEGKPEDAGRKGGLRQQLKDYLARMRQKLEEPRKKAEDAGKVPGTPPSGDAAPEAPEAQAASGGAPGLPTAEGPLALLEELGEYLPKRIPERRKNVFMRSDARLKLEYLKSRLDGRQGIKQKIEASYTPEASSDPLTLQKVADAFTFIKELAGHYPDPSVGTMMQSKVDSILRRIKG